MENQPDFSMTTLDPSAKSYILSWDAAFAPYTGLHTFISLLLHSQAITSIIWPHYYPAFRVHAPVHVAEAQVHAPSVNQNFHFLSKKKKTVCYVYKCMHL